MIPAKFKNWTYIGDHHPKDTERRSKTQEKKIAKQKTAFNRVLFDRSTRPLSTAAPNRDHITRLVSMLSKIQGRTDLHSARGTVRVARFSSAPAREF
jgi:hypothetical protein